MSINSKGNRGRGSKKCMETAASVVAGQKCKKTDTGAVLDKSTGAYYKPLLQGTRFGVLKGSNAHRIYIWAGAQRGMLVKAAEEGNLKIAQKGSDEKKAVTVEEVKKWTDEQVHTRFMARFVNSKLGQEIFEAGSVGGITATDAPSIECVSIKLLDEYTFDEKIGGKTYPRSGVGGAVTGDEDLEGLDALEAEEVLGLDDEE